jgi:hypothetical protein
MRRQPPTEGLHSSNLCDNKEEKGHSNMNLEPLTNKQLADLERLATELQAAIRKAKLHEEPLYDSLQQLKDEAGRIRRERFDAANSEYHGY